MIAASEELLSEISNIISESHPIDDNLHLKLTEVISKYHIKKIDDGNKMHFDLQENIELFLSGKQLEGLSKITLEGYKLHLRIFSENVKKDVKNISTADIRMYLSKYKDQKISTISTKLSVLKSFFSWLTSEEILTRDPTTRIKPPKKEKRLPKALSIEELEMLRESCITCRSRSLLEVMYATGCRLSEVHGIDKSHIDYQTQSLRVVGKGNKERVVFLSFKAIYHLKKYLLSRSDNSPALIVTERQPYRRLSKRGIQREIDIIAESSNIHKKISPHVLRHSFASLTLSSGMELVTLQEILGHSDPSTTILYTHVSSERKREQHRKYLIQ